MSTSPISTELIVVDKRHSSEIQIAEPKSDLLALISMAVQRGADLAMIEKLMDLKDRHEANEARKLFEQAVADFKAENIFIRKDKKNKQYDNSTYVSLGNLVTTVTPFLSKHGLGIHWDVDQAAGIKVTCVLSGFGHSRSCSMTVPPDKSGAKNPIQEIKSAITYAKACTFESICGLASTDANIDDDGNGSGKHRERMEDIGERLEWLANARNLDELEKLFKESYKVARAAKDTQAMQALVKAKDARKAGLQ